MRLLLILWLVILPASLMGQCTFDEAKTFTELVESIEEHDDFQIAECFNSPQSSIVSGACFYSCDGKSGFLIVRLGYNKYVYCNVPTSLFNAFNYASSKGTFYNYSIKNRYLCK